MNMRLSIRPVEPFYSRASPQMHVHCNTLTKSTTSETSLNMKNLHNHGSFRSDSSVLTANSTLASTSGSSWPMPSMKPDACIGSRWKEFQGIKDWQGLLDPLDNDLRGEIIRYGNFVEAAYRSCEFEPSSPSFAKCKYSKKKLLVRSGYSDTGYRVMANLTATSGIQLPEWTDKAPSWMGVPTSWIGYVAVCHDKRAISRLGRRDIIIALRGTATCMEWLENLRATLTPLQFPHPNSSPNDPCPMVQTGFLSLYTSKIGSGKSLQDLLRQEISRILELYGDEPLSLTFTGHSLGAALATLAAYDIKETFPSGPHVTVVSFGGPRVGNRSFRMQLEKQGTKVLRIVNSDDVITKVPGFVLDKDEDHVENNGESNMDNFSRWIQKLMEDTQWVYADVGCELRLSSRESRLFSSNNYNIAACHELKTYLGLVDDFVSSNCPLRATARKIMNKSSNVNRGYSQVN